MDTWAIVFGIGGLIGGPVLAWYTLKRQMSKERLEAEIRKEERELEMAQANLDRANKAFDMYTRLNEALEKRLLEMSELYDKDRAAWTNRRDEWENEKAELKRRIRDLETEVYNLKEALRAKGVEFNDRDEQGR